MSDRQRDENMPAYLAPLVGFRSRKAAQLCAYFASTSGGIIDKLKVIKLAYLSERKFLAEYHLPMLFDEFYSLPHGPICSSTLNGLDGMIHEDTWGEFIKRSGRDKIIATKKFDRDELDELSDAEISTLEASWREFGNLSAWEIRDYTHENCSEYTLVDKGRVPISYRSVLEAMGDADAEAVDREIDELRRVDNALSG